MTEISNNIIAGLLLIFIILNMIQTSIQITGVDNERVLGKVTVGFAGLCIVENATINAISNQTVLTQIPFYLDVNTTPADANVFFYDTFPFFNITADGIINFTANESDIGVHDQYLRINDSCGNFIHERFVRFTISTSNLAPILDFIPDQNLTQNEFFTYDVNATDPNLDPLIFGDNSTFFNIDPYTGIIQMNPRQEDVGNNSVLIYVYDDKYAIDQQIVNFEVVDVNDAPVLNPIGAQTAIINYTYYYDVNATDVDTTFPNTLTFGDNSTLFNINSTTGIIDFMAADGQNGTYSINITVTDGLLWDWEIISFTVTYENHPPNITWWDPEEYEIEMYEGDSIIFSIMAEDPDGTIPTAQWHMDRGVLTNAITYNYTYYPPVGSRGYHNLTVVVSDGELTDYHEWEILVKRREVQETVSPSGSTSTTSSPPPLPCMENWRCNEWETCRVDGYQLKSCRDLNKCGTVIFKPETARNCTYYPQPSCEDGIQNCHHGGCEIITDCGGPCPPCPTCSDGMRNQGEEGIDCGGPCPPCIEFQKPLKGEEKPVAYCGDKICGNNELFTCFADCSGKLAEYAIVIIIIFILIVLSYWYNEAALVALMKFKRIFLMAVGKKTSPVMSAKERVGTYTLIDLNRMNNELNQQNAQKIMGELSEAMRKFFSAAVHIGGEFTYIDLNEKAGELKIDDKTKKRISNFAMGMTKMEYSDEKASSSDVANLLHLAINIVESMTRTKTEKAVRVGKDIEIYNKNGTEEVPLEKKKEKTESPKTEKKKESRFSSFFKKQPEMTEVVKKETPPAEKKPDERRSPLFVLNKPKKQKTTEKPAEAERKEIVQPEKLVAPQPEVEMSFEGIRKKINELIEESERLCRMEDYKKAKEFYHEARDLYDRIPKERRKDLTEETIKFIRLYNQIVSNL